MATRSGSHRLGLLCVLLLAAMASATQFRVGGQRGWSVPDANAEPYNAWAGRMRFQIGDQLLFVYPKDTDSVLQVDAAAYNACNTSSYVARFADGNTVVTLDRSGPFFFIGGNEASCRANQKLIVVVLADRTGTRTPPAPPPTMLPPSSDPVPGPASATPPSAAAPTLAPATTPTLAPSPASPAPATTPTLAPSPASPAPASAPTGTPESSPPGPGALAPSPSTPGGAPQPPSSGSASAPGGGDGGSTTTPPPGNDAAKAVAGLVASLAPYIGYAMFAI